MKVINFKSCNFKGTYFLTSDIHSNQVPAASLFQKIEANANGENCIFINNGDTYSRGRDDLMTDVYTTFMTRNRNIQSVFNLGNAEFIYFLKKVGDVKDSLKQLSEAGVKLICTPIKYMFNSPDYPKEDIECIKPYAVVKDEIDGKEEDVIVVGTVDLSIAYGDPATDFQADCLADTIIKAREETGIKRVILASHNTVESTREILDKLREQGINDIEFVAGGHSHKIEDETYKSTRILHTAPEGNSAYKIKSDKDGFHMQQVKYDPIDRYNYSMQGTQNNPDIIANTEIDIEGILPEYREHVQKSGLFDVITQINFEVRNREVGYNVSVPSEMGTMYANKLKEKTGADIAICLSQDARGELPEIGDEIYRYQINKIMGVSKDVWTLVVSGSELFEIFNVSLRAQSDKRANSDFFEYSSNIKVERYPNVEKEEVNLQAEGDFLPGQMRKKRVKEIYIKEDGIWKPVSKMKDRQFTLATCSFVANGSRVTLEYFKNITNKKPFYPALKTRDVFEEGLIEIQNGRRKVEKSIMLDVV
ncbi:MAG: 5'-nucleotidase C-terminal domain-containing protein [Candidatus Gastranaerophilales bacterium]|nr:5'-nucleotidase C-terminal domain-containing protein [Candidatus Gastranaerophilales bacterium]